MRKNRTIAEQFVSMAQRRRDHTGVFYLGTRYSYGRIRDMADSFAAAMLDKGLAPGQRVAGSHDHHGGPRGESPGPRLRRGRPVPRVEARPAAPRRITRRSR